MKHTAYGLSRAFTIVELLVVIIIISILAAVSFASYTSMSNRAKAASAQSAAKQVATKLDVVKASKGKYPASLADVGFTDSGSTTYQYSASGNDSYCTTVTVSNKSYKVSNSDNLPLEGACPGHGLNGVVSITNIVPNPSFETNTNEVFGYFSAPVYRDTSSASHGSASAYTITNSATNPQGLVVTIDRGGSPGPYACSFSVSGTNGMTVQLGGRADSSSGTNVGEGFGSKAITLTSGWVRSNLSFTAPAGSSHVLIQLIVNSPASSRRIAIDGIICTKGSSIYDYYDGSSPGWIWNGAPHASSSMGPAA